VVRDDQVTALALAAGRGDRVALEDFIRATQREVWRTIARRVVVDQIRRNQARPRDMVEIRMLVAALDPDRRDALLLTQVLGLSYAEAAEVCGCPVGTIRSRVARARDDLIADTRRDHRTG